MSNLGKVSSRLAVVLSISTYWRCKCIIQVVLVIKNHWLKICQNQTHLLFQTSSLHWAAFTRLTALIRSAWLVTSEWHAQLGVLNEQPIVLHKPVDRWMWYSHERRMRKECVNMWVWVSFKQTIFTERTHVLSKQEWPKYSVDLSLTFKKKISYGL